MDFEFEDNYCCSYPLDIFQSTRNVSDFNFLDIGYHFSSQQVYFECFSLEYDSDIREILFNFDLDKYFRIQVVE